jgi:hypothetical protein
MVVERALGVFKGKWKRFTETVPGNNPRNTTKLIIGAMILHNWLIDEDIDSMRFRDAYNRKDGL